MTTSVPMYRSLAWRFFIRTALTVLGLVVAVLWVSRTQSRKQALETAEAGTRVSALIMESSFENRSQILEAGLEVFTTYNKNMVGIEQHDFASVRDSLLNNLASLKSDVAMVIRPSTKVRTGSNSFAFTWRRHRPMRGDLIHRCRQDSRSSSKP